MRELPDQWLPSLVKRALVHAKRIERAVPSRDGPRSDAASWPTMVLSADAEESRFRPNRDDVTHMEWVLTGYVDKYGTKHPAWLNGTLMGYRKQRDIFQRWVTWKSFSKFSHGVRLTEEEFAREVRTSLATLKRFNDFCAGTIAQQLNSVEFPVWRDEYPDSDKR